MPGTTRLLIVDDEQTVLKFVKTILTRANYDAVTCSSATEALQLLSEEPFDCIITDVVMPVTNGYELVKAIRNSQYFGDIPILMLTRKRDRQDVKQAVDVGVTDYVLKPIDEQLLLDKVELCLTKGGGKRYTYDCTVNSVHAKAELKYACSIAAISESHITAFTALPVPDEATIEIQGQLFDEIGIQAPLIKLIACKPSDRADFAYQSKFTFMGVPEVDLKKIRAWLHREEIRLRK
jgi:DNA-binding response OmpR family regulator